MNDNGFDNAGRIKRDQNREHDEQTATDAAGHTGEQQSNGHSSCCLCIALGEQHKSYKQACYRVTRAAVTDMHRLKCV